LADRKSYPLRLDPAIYEALRIWADDEMRSVNAQIEFLLARALRQAGRPPRAPGEAPPPPEQPEE
jgi:hypothetical protein